MARTGLSGRLERRPQGGVELALWAGAVAAVADGRSIGGYGARPGGTCERGRPVWAGPCCCAQYGRSASVSSGASQWMND